MEWTSWGLVNSKGTLRYPGFPTVAYVQMEASQGSGGALCSGCAVGWRPAGSSSFAPTLLVPADPPLTLLHTWPGCVLTQQARVGQGWRGAALHDALLPAHEGPSACTQSFAVVAWVTPALVVTSTALFFALTQQDLATAAKIQVNVPNLRRYGVNSDFVIVSCTAHASARYASCPPACNRSTMPRLAGACLHARLATQLLLPQRRCNRWYCPRCSSAGAIPARQPVLVFRPLANHHPTAVICHCGGTAAAGGARQ